MIFNSSNIQDIRKYYLGSYVKFQDLGDIICHIDEVGVMKEVEGERVPCIVGTTSNKDLFTIPLWDEQPYEVNYVLPKKGFFIHKQKLYQLRRIPARQYCRGVGVENTAIVQLLRDGRWSGCDLSSELLQAYVNKPDIRFPSVAELEKLTDTFTPILLSRRIAIVPFHKRVLLDMSAVGEYREGVVRVDGLFYQELSSLLKGSDVKVEVL